VSADPVGINSGKGRRFLLAIIDGGVYFAIEWVAERLQGDKADLIVMPRQSEGHQSPDRLSPV